MKIDLGTLWRIIPDADRVDCALIRRHYCSRMYLNSLCTTNCRKDCSDSLKYIFDLSRGEFIINQKAMLVGVAKGRVYDLVALSRTHKAETPLSELGEESPEVNPFAVLVEKYEATTTLR